MPSCHQGSFSEAIIDTARPLIDEASLDSAIAFASPILSASLTSFGENALDHALASARIALTLGSQPDIAKALILAPVGDHLAKPKDTLALAFGLPLAELAMTLRELDSISTPASTGSNVNRSALQAERGRKMLLAFSQDIRAILGHLSSRLAHIRHCSAMKAPPPESFSHDTLHVYAALAQRLGLSQIKWEMEDLSLRFLEPDAYKDIARKLSARRVDRETDIDRLATIIRESLRDKGIDGSIHGRPKHIHSILKKMRGKNLSFEQVLDIRAFRIIVQDVPSCYEALDAINHAFEPDLAEFDDYIAKPKGNGYRSLHAIVRDAAGSALEIQIRTQAMHDFAENGAAAHWAYKEAGAKGYAGVSATGDYDAKISALRQLIAWEQDLESLASTRPQDERIYVFTPQATLVELGPQSTPVDFAYAVHTNLGHCCRGAKVDGAMVPLQTPLKTGQSVEIITAKTGGPSRDWLNPELRFLASPRAKAKVRAWFNAQAHDATVAKGREIVEKTLHREGMTSFSHATLASSLHFPSPAHLYEAMGKETATPRDIEHALRPPAPPAAEPLPALRAASSPKSGSILVHGVDSMLSSLAGCCKPAPPEPIAGFVTRLKGISIHRPTCSNFLNISKRNPERVLPVQWNTASGIGSRFPVDLHIEAHDRQGLLRDIGDACAKEKTNVIATQTRSSAGRAIMVFTVELSSTDALAPVIKRIAALPDVTSVSRKI